LGSGYYRFTLKLRIGASPETGFHPLLAWLAYWRKAIDQAPAREWDFQRVDLSGGSFGSVARGGVRSGKVVGKLVAVAFELFCR